MVDENECAPLRVNSETVDKLDPLEQMGVLYLAERGMIKLINEKDEMKRLIASELTAGKFKIELEMLEAMKGFNRLLAEEFIRIGKWVLVN